MSVHQIRSALDTIDATPRDGFLADLEDQLLAAWTDDTALDVNDMPVDDGEHTPHTPHRRRWMLVAAATIVVLALGLVVAAAIQEPDSVQTDTVPPTPAPSTHPATTSPPVDSLPATIDTAATVLPSEPSGIGPAASASATSGGMWPQATVEEVRVAQERADAGDPAYTWQVDPQLIDPSSWNQDEPPKIELVDRFIREVLGWEAYTWNAYGEVVLPSLQYLRCASDRTNPLYPPGREPAPGELCAPTIDDLNYETVSLQVAQLDSTGPTGIWVVSRWGLSEPFTQADPAVAEAQGRDLLEKFLAARVAGQGAEGHVRVFSNGEQTPDVPLLYATTSGAPYERYEIERVGSAAWPNGHLLFKVRLFADGGTTVVEQQIDRWSDGGLYLNANSTTENAQPITISHTSPDGGVTVSAPSTWDISLWPRAARDVAPDVWFGLLSPTPILMTDTGNESIGLVDPVAYDTWCAAHGGSPLLSAAADAAAIAQQVLADPNFETTAPVAARIGGLEAVSIDVALAPGGQTCAPTATCSSCAGDVFEKSGWIHSLEAGLRLRLYLVDLPEGMSVDTLAITVLAPEERFDQFIEETTPIIDSMTFHPPAP